MVYQSFKSTLFLALISGLVFSAIGSTASAQAKAEPGSYKVDPTHSKVGFEVAHLVISSVEGKFDQMEGDVEVAADFTKSKVSATVIMDSIDTGVAKRDAHLKSPEFFDVAKFKTMTFKSTSISGSPEAFKMEGDLTIRDKKKKVTFDGKYLGAVTDPWGNRKVAFKATTKINRKDFGLTWNNMADAGPVVGDEVSIELNIQAARPQDAAKK